MDYDVVIIGAGFAGLSSALTMARRGLKVGVLERKQNIGDPIQTTGIFIQKVVDEFAISKKFIENDIRGIFVYSPSGKCYTINYEVPRFYLGDIRNFQKDLADECMRWGVKFHLETACSDINIKKTKVKINDFESKCVVLACGCNKELVNELTGDYVRKFLIGMEFVGKGINARDPKYFEVLFDHELAPGYCAWIAPITKKINHIGLCRYFPHDTNIRKELLEYLERRTKSKLVIEETRSNLIPISGPIKKTYGDRFLVIGDAAGQTGAMSAGGIFFALNIGKIAGNVISDNIENPGENELAQYETKWKRKYSKYLNLELRSRFLFDRINSNDELEILLKLLKNQSILKETKKVLSTYEISYVNLFQEVFSLMLRNPTVVMKVLGSLVR